MMYVARSVFYVSLACVLISGMHECTNLKKFQIEQDNLARKPATELKMNGFNMIPPPPNIPPPLTFPIPSENGTINPPLLMPPVPDEPHNTNI